MIELVRGDILGADAEALVNPVNCVGVMGKGLALAFRQAYPENFEAYRQACEQGRVQPGRLFVFDTGRTEAPRWIVNFPTKRHWRDKSRLEDIEAGLAALKTEIVGRGIRSVAVPALGAGLGGLNWLAVRSRIEAVLGDLAGVRITVFEPRGRTVVTGASSRG